VSGFLATIFGWFLKGMLGGGSSSGAKEVNVSVEQNVRELPPKPEFCQKHDPRGIEALHQACTAKTHCRLTGLARGEKVRGRLVAFDNNQATVDLLTNNGDPLVPLRLLSAYVLTFFFNDKQMMCSGLVVQFDREPARLVLELTSDVSSGNVRRDFRVNVQKDDGLTVQVRCGLIMFSPLPLDLSFSGMLFEAPLGAQLELDQEVQVVLTMAGNRAELTGEVRRREGQKYGVFFSETPFSSGRDATSLRKIVKTIELYRIKQSRGG
jgi:hypothetical protein